MPCGCPPKCDPQAVKVFICCSWPPLTDELKALGITDADWQATKKIWDCGGMMLIACCVVVAMVLAGICAALQFGAGVSPEIWALMSATNLARLANFYIIPTQTLKIQNEIYSKKNIKVTFLIEFCSEGLAFSAEKGAQTLGAP
mmetsp:Transcript_76546/g.169146  ORF Transcript_76546/g.169146 Transcript_76546/m.169146 type:complete len:144 (-) Transcript_76546:97-528(-)